MDHSCDRSSLNLAVFKMVNSPSKGPLLIIVASANKRELQSQWRCVWQCSGTCIVLPHLQALCGPTMSDAITDNDPLHDDERL